MISNCFNIVLEHHKNAAMAMATTPYDLLHDDVDADDDGLV